MTAVGARAALCLPGAHTKRTMQARRAAEVAATCWPGRPRTQGETTLGGGAPSPPRGHMALWLPGPGWTGALVGVLWFRELVRQRWQERPEGSRVSVVWRVAWGLGPQWLVTGC